MALLDTIKGLFGNGTEQNEGGSGKVYIVDAASLEQNDNKQLSPHQKIQILKGLANFVKKEGINIEALFEGDPLRVVADGGDFSGVTVYYTGKKMDLNALIAKRLKARGGTNATVIATAQKAEAVAEEAGAQFMSNSTFKKALGIEKPRGGSRGKKRKGTKPPSSSKRGGKKPRQQGRSKKKEQTSKSEKEHVSDLIDLVD